MGNFVSTGSQQFGLPESISQSPSGRVGLVELLPLLLGEMLRRLHNTAAYVTPDQHGALAIADQLAVMQAGRYYPSQLFGLSGSAYAGCCG